MKIKEQEGMNFDQWVDLLNKHGAAEISEAAAVVHDVLWTAQKIVQSRKTPDLLPVVFDQMMKIMGQKENAKAERKKVRTQYAAAAITGILAMPSDRAAETKNENLTDLVAGVADEMMDYQE